MRQLKTRSPTIREQERLSDCFIMKILDTERPKTSTSAKTSSGELDRLREILLAKHSAELSALENRLFKLEDRLFDVDNRAADTGEVLASAILERRESDSALGEALKPIVVHQFKETSREDPEVMAEALFPILGPAVRKMIVNMLSPDKSSKKRGYQVEQLFVIDKETGLPVTHVSSPSAQTQDAEMVSGMLSAIQSFVQEAFETDEFDGLNTLQLGELSVWIEWGPTAVLAGVVRGAPPKTLRNAMQIQIEKIHREYGQELETYDGDPTKLEPLNPDLAEFLESHDGSFINRLKNLPKTIVNRIVLILIASIAILGWFGYGQYQLSQWHRFIAMIEAEPGIVVTQQTWNRNGSTISGLMDPLAVSPKTLLMKTSIDPGKVIFKFENFQAIAPEFTLKRAIALLNPPPDVEVTLFQTTLYVRGESDSEWARQATLLTPALNGVDRLIFEHHEGQIAQ